MEIGKIPPHDVEAEQAVLGSMLLDKDAVINRAPEDIKLLASEMEAFALFYNAKRENKKAACLLTVVDVPKQTLGLTAEERQKSLNNMIELALDSVLKL